MNADKIKAFADYIEGAENWDLSSWQSCFVGHWLAFTGSKRDNAAYADFYGFIKAMDITEKAGLALAMPKLAALNGEDSYDPFAVNEARKKTSREHAAAVLRHLARTGEVDWSVKPKGKKLPASITDTLRVPTWEDFEATN